MILGVMHMVDFAHGEFIAVTADAAFGVVAAAGWGWWAAVPLIFLGAVGTSVAIKFVAFRWVRGSSDFTMLLKSFAVHFLVQAIFVMPMGAGVRSFPRPEWADRIWSVDDLDIQVVDGSVIGATAATSAATVYLLQRTMFGISPRAAAEDFEAARLMGERSNKVIRQASILAGAQTRRSRPPTRGAPHPRGPVETDMTTLGRMTTPREVRS